ncbi:hypothetical protein COL154_005752 [Colletotrichum chrysophilum]|nr:hypothetical protein COL154_005752 [Colletotrichum chrysophilum]
MPLTFQTNDDDIDISGADTIAGLKTFANLPFVDCFSGGDAEGQLYDIAIFGAPHDTHLILNTSIHAGIRAPLIRRKGDLRNDVRCGFEIVTARDLDKLGAQGIISKIKERVGDSKVYISVDIDVLDPAFAPGIFDWPV